jgi:UDP-glucose 4-epimerase
MPQTILVTGAAGFIGSHTCDKLLEAGHRVIAVDNFRTGLRPNLLQALRYREFVFREADITMPGVLAGIAQEFSPAALIHLAALVSVQQSTQEPDENFRINVLGTHLAAEAARIGRIPRVVFASSAATYNLQSPYGAAKLASESLLLGHSAAYGFTVINQRYFNVYGTRQDPKSPYSGVISIFAQRITNGLPITVFGDGEQTRDFVSVQDVARANLLAATIPTLTSRSIDICTGVETTINRLAQLLAAASRRTLTVLQEPPRHGDIRHSKGNPEPAADALRFIPKILLDAGLMALLERGT